MKKIIKKSLSKMIEKLIEKTLDKTLKEGFFYWKKMGKRLLILGLLLLFLLTTAAVMITGVGLYLIYLLVKASWQFIKEAWMQLG